MNTKIIKPMKYLLLFAVSVFLLMACQEKGPDRWQADSPEVAITEALVDDYVSGDWDAWNGHYADTAKVYHNSIESMSTKDLMSGLQGDIANYSSYGFSDEGMYTEMIIDDKNDKWVYFWGTWQGTMKGTDQKFDIPVHIALKFVDNKIVEEHAFYNRSAVDVAIKELAMAKEAAPSE